MKRVIILIVFILVFLVGLSVLLYPFVSDYVNSMSQSRVITDFNAQLAELNEVDYSELLSAAREYNARLLKKSNRFILDEEELAEYHKMLNFTGTDVIGTLEIEAIKVKLPIYLGTEESALQVGIGHLKGSSIPIGGKGAHSVISGHRGLPSSTLLTNADMLDVGDIFVLKILNETLIYQIDHIIIVEPEDFGWLAIDPDEDYCTLFTCTPIGVNSHRLLVRGTRIFPESDGDEPRQLESRRVLRADAKNVNAIVAYILTSAPILIIVFIFSLVKSRKSKRR